MAQVNIHEIAARPAEEREKALRILAKSIFRELKTQGYDNKQIVGLATELISQVTTDLGRDAARDT